MNPPIAAVTIVATVSTAPMSIPFVRGRIASYPESRATGPRTVLVPLGFLLALARLSLSGHQLVHRVRDDSLKNGRFSNLASTSQRLAGLLTV